MMAGTRKPIAYRIRAVESRMCNVEVRISFGPIASMTVAAEQGRKKQ